MAYCPPRRVLHRRLLLLSTGVAVAVLTAGCAKFDKFRQPRPAPYGKTASAPTPQLTNPLHSATSYWATAHLKDSKDPEVALNYAVNLKALGANDKAMEVLATAHGYHPADPRIASEYGRLALQADQLDLAERLLNVAEKNSRRPDWHVMAAKGTLYAKRGQTEAARRYYMAALQQNPNSLSTLNNLALSYALDGKPKEAESLLRRAVAKGADDERVRQNLALVLGLQGKYSDGLQIAQAALPDEQASANMTYLRNMTGRQETAVAEAPKESAPSANKTPAPILPVKVAASADRPAEQRRPLEEWAANRPASATTTAEMTVAAVPSMQPGRTSTVQSTSTQPTQTAATFGGWSATVSREPARLVPNGR